MDEKPKDSKAIRMSNLIPGPKPRKKKKELRVHCEDLTDTCIDVLEGIMRSPKSRPADRISAATLILAYAHGKPKQQLEHSGNIDSKVTLVADKP